MKSCLNCGAEAPEASQQCAECGRAFAWYRPGPEPADGVKQDIWSPATGPRRPNGAALIGWGIGLLIAGTLAAILSSGIDTTNFMGGVDSSKVARKAAFFYGGAACLGLGMMFWAVGYIVRAIWFLPGRGEGGSGSA